MPYRFLDRSPCPVCARLDAGPDPVTVAWTEFSAAYVPSRQPTPGTALAVPRRHVRAPGELSAAEDDDLWLLVCRLAGAALTAFGGPSYHVSQYLGAITGEPLDHLWWRVEPRNASPPSTPMDISALPIASPSQRERYAHQLRQALAP